MVQRLAEKMHKLDFDDEVTGLIYGHAFRSGEPPARLNSQQVCLPGVAARRRFYLAAPQSQPRGGGEVAEKSFRHFRFFFHEIRHGSHTTRIERRATICSPCSTT